MVKARRDVAILFGIALALVSMGCAPAKTKPKDPATATANNIRLAESYYQAGRVSEALSILQKAVDSAPTNAPLLNYYGQLSFLAGRNDVAEASFTKALALDPHLTDARNNLGSVYDATGKKTQAEQEYKAVLKDTTYPTPEKVYMNLGLLYGSQGRQEEAIANLRRAVELNPKFWHGHFELASALDRAGLLDEAAREYEVGRTRLQEQRRIPLSPGAGLHEAAAARRRARAPDAMPGAVTGQRERIQGLRPPQDAPLRAPWRSPGSRSSSAV
jgi:Tfp pilus assembly protein PilF